ncbi:MAG TPA: hypothetical protein VFQ85_18445 [Mycobacteriales bacterium]|nr:hypothetical protein [Mycobacteriales bacterium]
MTPPPRPWLLAYRLLGLRLPEEYRPWVVTDVRSRSFLGWRILRTFLWLLVGIGLYAVGQHAKLAWPAKKTFVLLVCFAALYAVLASRKTLVRRMLAWQRISATGEPVAPKRLDRLENAQAALGAVLALVLLTAGSAVLGYGLRPTSFAGAPCEDPDPADLDRIRAAINHPNAKLLIAKELHYGDQSMITVVLSDPTVTDPKSAERGRLEYVLVRDGVMSRLNIPEITTWLDLPVSRQVDRSMADAMTRAVKCFKRVSPR